MEIDVDFYRNFSTDELVNLTVDISSLQSEYIPILQKELFDRNENKVALSITEYLTSIKYYIPHYILFDTIQIYRKEGFSEVEIYNKLIDKHGLDSNYIDLIMNSLNQIGRDNITIGIIMIIAPIILGIILITKNTFIGLIPLIIITAGIWKINKGYKQIRKKK